MPPFIEYTRSVAQPAGGEVTQTAFVNADHIAGAVYDSDQKRLQVTLKAELVGWNEGHTITLTGEEAAKVMNVLRKLS